jgi:phosphoribosylglycinamide formyltransferase 1
MQSVATESASCPIAVLISGSGTTLQNLVKRIVSDDLPLRIVQVISSKPGVLGIERAKSAGLSVEVIERKGFSSIEAFSEHTFDLCRRAGAKIVCLAGYLQLLRIPEDYRGKVLNIHPALLPAFSGKGMYGHRVHRAVLDKGAKVSGCTVHFVDDQYDHGAIIAQSTVEVRDGDTPETLAARVFAEECELYPRVIHAVADGLLGESVEPT